MPDIVLTTLNAKFSHAAFGLRYLFANLGELQPRAVIAEFDINLRPLDIAEALLAREPLIIGFGIYIWNVTETTEVITAIRRVRPDIKIILGGPEVSYETEGQRIVELADHVITGEADLKFAEVCRTLLGVQASAGPEETPKPANPLPKIILAEIPEFSRLALPYDYYTGADLAHRIVYVEASRGCPFTCEFCLSSLEIPVRQVPLDKFLAAMQSLLDRGLKQFKFVDRTFNLNIVTSKAILEFFLARYQPGHFYHFEMIPDRLPAELRAIIAKFPPGALQFEVGIQTFNPEVGTLISRRQNYDRLADNFQYLRRETGVHIHADLIIGLPGETVQSFATGFDRLIALDPQEIQVGILKRLRGTPIIRHDQEWQMIYNAHPPYDILQNKLIDFATMQRLRRFAKYWDLIGNSGNFVETTPLLWSNGTPFAGLLRFSDWLYAQIGRTDTIALARLAEKLFEFITVELNIEKQLAAETLWRDWQRGARRDPPEFIRSFLPAESLVRARTAKSGLPKRQARHLATETHQ
ncbi:MAG TPA: radical SAM protein [Verrucomicrobiae bacterium]|nr:radical SAM protein [Verrucomicrobiae bacterium]